MALRRRLAHPTARSHVLAAALVGVLLTTSTATAGGTSPARADGAYGRLDGDVAVSADATLTVGEDGSAVGAKLSTSYLTMAGAYVAYDEGVGPREQPLVRRVAGGIAVRPLFFARFLTDLERGPPLYDLWLDSIGVDLGAFVAWRNDPGCEDACRSDGLEIAGAMGLPLLARAGGPWLGARVGARFPLGDTPLDLGPQGFVAISLGYQHAFASGLAGRSP